MYLISDIFRAATYVLLIEAAIVLLWRLMKLPVVWMPLAAFALGAGEDVATWAGAAGLVVTVALAIRRVRALLYTAPRY